MALPRFLSDGGHLHASCHQEERIESAAGVYCLISALICAVADNAVGENRRHDDVVTTKTWLCATLLRLIARLKKEFVRHV